MNTKKIKIEFYVGRIGPSGTDGLVSRILLDLINKANCPCHSYSGMHYQIRKLTQFNNGESFKGIFAKIRKDDIPHIGSTEGDEREITLDESEGVIEKNHFIYFRKNELLVYQTNKNGSALNALGSYFSSITNHATAFNPIVKLETIKRLMSQNMAPSIVELTVARPTNPDLYPQDDWSQDLFKLMGDMGGAKIRFTIKPEGRGKSRGTLASRVKGWAADLVLDGMATTAKVTLPGIDQPFDLIKDRLAVTLPVQMEGRYPSEDMMFHALRKAKDQSSSELEAFFGGENALN
jgi:hypothetical protein